MNSPNILVICFWEYLVFAVRKSVSSFVSSGLDYLSLLLNNDAFRMRDDFIQSTLLEAKEKYENVGKEALEHFSDKWPSTSSSSIACVELFFIIEYCLCMVYPP